MPQEKIRCACCGQACTVGKVDFGIGPYEFWGVKGVHHDERVVTECCESEYVFNGEGEEVEASSVEIDECQEPEPEEF